MSNRRGTLSQWLSENLLQVVALIGAILLWYPSIATKPYVDEGLAANRKYTDDKAATTLAAAIAHADSNRQANALKMEAIGADVKALAVKTDLLLQIQHDRFSAPNESKR